MRVEEDAEILEPFGVGARCNHGTKTIDVSVTLCPELAPNHRNATTARRRSRKSVIAGAGYGPFSATRPWLEMAGFVTDLEFNPFDLAGSDLEPDSWSTAELS